MPTYRQGRMVIFPMLKQLLGGRPHLKINESDLSIKFKNGSEIAIKGADNEDSLRGVSLSRVVLDEYAFMKPNVWEEIIYPSLIDTPKSSALFIGTPDGHNHFYDIFLKGQKKDKDWKSWQFKTIDGGFVPKEEINKAKTTMDEKTFRQEFEATFESSGNKVAYNFDRNKHIKQANELGHIKWAGIDFNVDYMSASACSEYTDSTLHYYDEIRLKNSNTDEMAQAIKNKWKNIKDIYPDPSGTARSTTSSESDFDILRAYGFNVIAHKKAPTHRDRISALNFKLKDATGRVKMTVDPQCVELIKDLELCSRDKNGGIDKTDINRTHALDSATYGLHYRHPVRKPITRTYSL